LLARELGRFLLGPEGFPMSKRCVEFLLKATPSECLDIIELSFKVVNTDIRNQEHGFLVEQLMDPDAAIEELNSRFAEHALGFEFVENQIVRKDSEFLHSEAVKPAIS